MLYSSCTQLAAHKPITQNLRSLRYLRLAGPQQLYHNLSRPFVFTHCLHIQLRALARLIVQAIIKRHKSDLARAGKKRTGLVVRAGRGNSQAKFACSFAMRSKSASMLASSLRSSRLAVLSFLLAPCRSYWLLRGPFGSGCFQGEPTLCSQRGWLQGGNNELLE